MKAKTASCAAGINVLLLNVFIKHGRRLKTAPPSPDDVSCQHMMETHDTNRPLSVLRLEVMCLLFVSHAQTMCPLSVALISSVLHSSLTLTIIAHFPAKQPGGKSTRISYNLPAPTQCRHLLLCICRLLPFAHMPSFSQFKWPVSCSLAWPVKRSRAQDRTTCLCSG